MPRLIKCVDTGLEARKEDSYYVPSMRRYFSSQDGYEKWKKQTNREEPDKFYPLVCEFLGKKSDFPKGVPFPGIVLKKMQTQYKCMGYEALWLALTKKEKTIDWYMGHKEFKNYTQRMLYMLGMVKDDVPVEFRNLSLLKAKQQASESVSEADTEIVLSSQKHAKKTKNLSELLLDEEEN